MLEQNTSVPADTAGKDVVIIAEEILVSTALQWLLPKGPVVSFSWS